MAIVQEVKCDFCGRVLVGGTQYMPISRSHIEFAGFIRDWEAVPKSTWRNQTYISHPDKRPMAFCTNDNATCFMDYVSMKRTAQRVYHEQKSRDDASIDWDIRNSGGGRGY